MIIIANKRALVPAWLQQYQMDKMESSFLHNHTFRMYLRDCYIPHVPTRLLHSTCTYEIVTSRMYLRDCYIPHVPTRLLHSACTYELVTFRMYLRACYIPLNPVGSWAELYCPLVLPIYVYWHGTRNMWLHIYLHKPFRSWNKCTGHTGISLARWSQVVFNSRRLTSICMYSIWDYYMRLVTLTSIWKYAVALVQNNLILWIMKRKQGINL